MPKQKYANKSLTNWIVAMLILYLFYYSYRYVFRYNAEMTSPTYSDTPLFFQLAKYIILILLILGAFGSILNQKLNPSSKLAYVLLWVLIIQSVYSFILCKDIDDLSLIICFCPAVLVMSFSGNINVITIDKVCHFFMCFTIVYELIQLGLYFINGRLPALGYDTGYFYDVRFGGAWDDPNGFSVMLAFFIPYAFCKFRSVKRIVYVALLSIFLILTWSLTGIFSFIALMIILLLNKAINYKKYTLRKFVKILVVVALFTTLAVLVYVWQYSSINSFIQGKMGSIYGHLDSFDLSSISVLTLLGFVPAPRQMESGLVSLIYHGGILQLVIFYVFAFIAVAACRSIIRKINKDKKIFPVYCGMFCYMVAFLIANINLPMLYMFSNVGIFALFAVISINNYKEKKSVVKHSYMLAKI